MKHKVRDLIIFCIDILGISFLYRLYCRTKGPLVRVVCFHDVPDTAWFESVVKMCVENYHVLTPEQFHAKEFHHKKINILLSFDDGYQSWIDHCLPVLEKYQVKGLFFINSGLLDIAEDETKVAVFMKERLLIEPKKALTWDGAKTLASGGHTIGGHTVTHPNLATLDLFEVKKEIAQDKSRLGSVLGVEIVDFAFPFGTEKHITTEGEALVSECGYRYRYSAITGFYDKPERLIPRTLAEKQQPIPSIKRWVRGGYDVFSRLKIV